MMPVLSLHAPYTLRAARTDLERTTLPEPPLTAQCRAPRSFRPLSARYFERFLTFGRPPTGSLAQCTLSEASTTHRFSWSEPVLCECYAVSGTDVRRMLVSGGSGGYEPRHYHRWLAVVCCYARTTRCPVLKSNTRAGVSTRALNVPVLTSPRAYARATRCPVLT
eukprot:3934640-Rhodomonas_salina.2